MIPPAPITPMEEITYKLESADLAAFYRHYRRTSRITRRIYAVLFLMVAGLSIDLTMRHSIAGIGNHIVYFLFPFSAMGTAVPVLSFVMTRLMERSHFRDAGKHGLFCEHTITLTPGSVTERTPVSEQTSTWRGVLRIDATDTHIFIFTQPNAAHVIPRAAFPTATDADRFLATANDYVKAANRAAGS